MTRRIIAFVGVAGSGKDYRANQLAKKGFRKIAFAEPLRCITFAALGIPYNEGMKKYELLKKTPVTTNGRTLRQVMEGLGTEGIRKYDEDFWINCVLRELDKNSDSDYCITDMRFINEYIAIRNYCAKNSYDFQVIFCDFISHRYQEYNEHPSAMLAQDIRDNWKAKDGQDVTYLMARICDDRSV